MKKNIILLTIGVGLIISAVLPTVIDLVGGVHLLNVHAEIMEEDIDKKEDIREDDSVEEEDDAKEENEAESDTEILPKLYIKAVNPGYKIDGVNNVGEMIEIARIGDPDTPISLAGTTFSYTNSSGNTTVLVEFPEHSWMTGENILLRLASSPGSELANITYTKTLAMTAGISLIVNGEVVDEVCWTGKENCHKAFSSASPTTLVRNLETGEFEHQFAYEPKYVADNYQIDMVSDPDETKPVVSSQCKSLSFSEILSYYESAKSEQFVEFYNGGTSAIVLDGCKLKYKNKKYVLSGRVEPEGYFAYYPIGFSLTKNPVSSNKLEIIDTDDVVVDTLEYPNGQRKGTAYALLGADAEAKEIWKTTYAPTPGAPNNYQEFRTCEAGKVINEVTGNCVKITSVSEKICQEGYYFNILTGRCKKKITTGPKTCKEGYYLNPETNRCKKIVDNKGADYGLEPENYEENMSFIALYAVLGVMGVGMVYLGWEFRGEMKKLVRKVFRRFH